MGDYLDRYGEGRRPNHRQPIYLTDFPMRTILNDFVGWAIIRRPNMEKPEGQSSDNLSNAGKHPFSAVPTVPEVGKIFRASDWSSSLGRPLRPRLDTQLRLI